MILKEFLRKRISPSLFLKMVNAKNSILPSESYRQKKAYINKGADFYKQLFGANALVFDIGANYGNKVEMFLKAGARVVAVEPQEKCCRYLKSVYGNQITLIQKGVGEEDTIKDFYVSENTALSSFEGDWLGREKRFVNEKIEHVEKVVTTTLDKLVQLHGVPDFIKIDVEGYEQNVLKGLTRKIRLISFEYALPDSHSSIEKCISEIRRIGDVEINYSIGESMVLCLKRWLEADAFLVFSTLHEFLGTSAGDIYVRVK